MIRQRVLATAGEPSIVPATPLWQWLAPVTCVLVLAVTVWVLRQPTPPETASTGVEVAFATAVATDETATRFEKQGEQQGRQVYFQTQGGTRVVWVLYDQ